jgi:hypothetical protein
VKFSGSPREVRVRLDGPTVVANGTASIHRSTAGNHGYEVQVVACASFASGRHRFDVECFDPVRNQWAELKNSPLCTKGGTRAPC